MKKRKRLLWQLFPSYLLITLIALLAVSWYASGAMRQFFLDQTATDLKARAALLDKQIKGLLSPLNSDAIDAICKEAGRLSATRITVILPDGTVSEVEVLESSSPNLGFEQAAMNAVEQWKFEPARVGADAVEVFHGEAVGPGKVVVEAVFDHRTDGDLALGVQALHGLRQQVRR